MSVNETSIKYVVDCKKDITPGEGLFLYMCSCDHPLFTVLHIFALLL